MVDFIIVGRGLAASVLMHTFYRAGITFTVIGDETLSTCSRVAAGIWNPVVFKRMTSGWMAETLVGELMRFYPACEALLKAKCMVQRQIVRPFSEEQEKALWRKKAGAELAPFLVEDIQYNLAGLEGLKIKNGYGLVEAAGNLDVQKFLEYTAGFFRERIRDEVFDHSAVQIAGDHVGYKTAKAGSLIFCEGHLVSRNPFFSWLPLKPAKGEILTVSSEDIHLRNRIFNRDGFLMDTGGTTFKLGATYNWQERNDDPGATGRLELAAKMKNMTDQPYTVLKHEAGIRPASIDRRPLIGRHPVHERLFIFNGLGAKGVMLAPFFAGKFVAWYLKKEDICSEADIRRFYHLYERG